MLFLSTIENTNKDNNNIDPNLDKILLFTAMLTPIFTIFISIILINKKHKKTIKDIYIDLNQKSTNIKNTDQLQENNKLQNISHLLDKKSAIKLKNTLSKVLVEINCYNETIKLLNSYKSIILSIQRSLNKNIKEINFHKEIELFNKLCNNLKLYKNQDDINIKLSELITEHNKDEIYIDHIIECLQQIKIILIEHKASYEIIKNKILNIYKEIEYTNNNINLDV